MRWLIAPCHCVWWSGLAVCNGMAASMFFFVVLAAFVPLRFAASVSQPWQQSNGFVRAISGWKLHKTSRKSQNLMFFRTKRVSASMWGSLLVQRVWRHDRDWSNTSSMVNEMVDCSSHWNQEKVETSKKNVEEKNRSKLTKSWHRKELSRERIMSKELKQTTTLATRWSRSVPIGSCFSL